jgi:hypothetical protein
MSPAKRIPTMAAVATATFIVAADGITTTIRITLPIGVDLTAMPIPTNMADLHMPFRTVTDTGTATMLASLGTAASTLGIPRPHLSGRPISTSVMPRTLLAGISSEPHTAAHGLPELEDTRSSIETACED